jgi:hypothetical protein
MSFTRTVKSAHSPVYADALNKTISLQVTFVELETMGDMTFLATPDDIEPHGKAILASALAGQYGAIGQYVAPAPKT